MTKAGRRLGKVGQRDVCCLRKINRTTREWCEKQGAEIYYAYAVTPWCFITGDLRYVAPLPKELGNALIAAQRLNMRF